MAPIPEIQQTQKKEKEGVDMLGVVEGSEKTRQEILAELDGLKEIDPVTGIIILPALTNEQLVVALQWMTANGCFNINAHPDANKNTLTWVEYQDANQHKQII